jgi:hypothetical protein
MADNAASSEDKSVSLDLSDAGNERRAPEGKKLVEYDVAIAPSFAGFELRNIENNDLKLLLFLTNPPPFISASGCPIVKSYSAAST